MIRSADLGLDADDYMTKPFSPSELVARVKAHLARYERLIGSGMPRKMRSLKSVGLKIDTDSQKSMGERRGEKHLPPESSICLAFLAQTSKPCIHERRAVPAKSGIWNLSEILRQ